MSALAPSSWSRMASLALMAWWMVVMRMSQELMGLPSSATMRSPACKPAVAAGESGATSERISSALISPASQLPASPGVRTGESVAVIRCRAKNSPNATPSRRVGRSATTLSGLPWLVATAALTWSKRLTGVPLIDTIWSKFFRPASPAGLAALATPMVEPWVEASRPTRPRVDCIRPIGSWVSTLSSGVIVALSVVPWRSHWTFNGSSGRPEKSSRTSCQ